MSKICELIKEKRIYFDGGMGTMLQKRGLKPGELPEIWNLEHPDIIEDIHRQYLESGANIITTNTFGVNFLKHSDYDKLISAGISCAQKSLEGFPDTFVAFDIGPLGRFLEPIGEISFDEAVEIFAKNIRVARDCGVDLIVIETMTDSYETKAAVIAAKENCDLPIFVTNVYDEKGKMLTGADPESMIAMLEGLGVTAIGINCSFGPDKMLPLIEVFKNNSSLPIIANPNAGLPSIVDGKAVYSMDADVFSDFAVLLFSYRFSTAFALAHKTPRENGLQI
jgi:5-methyltetrahydrofolate--homocysteine methyltransferase